MMIDWNPQEVRSMVALATADKERLLPSDIRAITGLLDRYEEELRTALASHTQGVRDAALEDAAKHFDERAQALSGDIFATTTTRAEICRTVARELRTLKSGSGQ
jgi:hypothetical protein